MEICDETIKQISCDFFRWWYNAPGNNTEQGFDEWWKENKGRYVEVYEDEDPPKKRLSDWDGDGPEWDGRMD